MREARNLARRLPAEQIRYNDSSVVNDLLLFHPSSTSFCNQAIYRLRRSDLPLHHFQSFLICDELPQTIRGDDKELVRLRVQLEYSELRF